MTNGYIEQNLYFYLLTYSKRFSTKKRSYLFIKESSSQMKGKRIKKMKRSCEEMFYYVTHHPESKEKRIMRSKSNITIFSLPLLTVSDSRRRI